MEEILGIAGIGAVIYFVIPLIKSFVNNSRARVIAVFAVSIIIGSLAIAARGDYGLQVQEVVKDILTVFGAAQAIYLTIEKLLKIGVDESMEKMMSK